MTPLETFIADELALLPVVDRVAPEALAYGTDLSCVLDITPTADEVDPESVVALGEALVRRFISPRNSVIDDESYGLDLRGRLNTGVTQQDLTRLKSQVRVECLKDDRVSDVNVTLVISGRSMRVALAVTPHSPLDTFSLTFFVTADGLQLQGSIDQHG